MTWVDIERRPCGMDSVYVQLQRGKQVSVLAVSSEAGSAHTVMNDGFVHSHQPGFSAAIAEAAALIRKAVRDPSLAGEVVEVLGVETFGGIVEAMRWVASLRPAAGQGDEG